METMTAVVKDLNNGIKFVIGKEFTIMSQGYAVLGILENSKCIKLPSSDYEVVVVDFVQAIELSNELFSVETVYKINLEERLITNPEGVMLTVPHKGDMTLHDLVHLLELFNK